MSVFSIIVPIYRVEKYLEECIQSVLEQDFSEYELILVDDGSPDGCPQIADRYAGEDTRIRVIHKQNEGLTLARNSGLLICEGEYVINLDGDDRLMPGALSVLAAEIQKTHADVYFYGYAEDENQRLTAVLPDFSEGMYAGERRKILYQRMIYDNRKPFFHFGLVPSVWTRAVRRELFCEVRLQIDPKLYMGEDFATTLPIMLKADTIFCIRKPLYAYRILQSSVSHRFYLEEMRDMAIMLCEFEKLGEPCEKFGIREQLGAYMVYVLFQYVCSLGRNSKSYGEYQAAIQAIDPIIFRYIRAWHVRKYDPRALGMTAAVKCRLWRILWIYAKRERDGR